MRQVWKFKTRRFAIRFYIERDRHYRYDGDDENGETQRKLDSGEYIAFSSMVRVYLDGEIIGEDFLGGSVYENGNESEFWKAHRDSDPMNRNSSIMRAKSGANSVICHYFPDMIAIACREARKNLERRKPIPRMRA